MKIVLAPEGFKGSLSGVQVCRAMEEGVRLALGAAQTVAIPLADGGEGTLEALLVGAGGRAKMVRVQGPLGAGVEADWGFLPDGRAVIEMAQASGLTLIAPGPLDALRASSYGTGQLIKSALDAGCREIVVGLGGSATSDGGSGALSALGLRLYDARDRILPPGGGALESLATIDTRFLDARLAKTKLTVLCDVSNPLHGPQGAARIYGPQKGASSSEIEKLERGLQRLADVTATKMGFDLRDQAGAGAAGGIAFALMAFCQAQLQSGIEFVLQANDFTSAIAGADLILTGEGALDSQTLSGKTVAGVCRIARIKQVPVVAFGGAVRLTGDQMDQLGLHSAFALADGPRSLEECLASAPTLLAQSVERALRMCR